MGRENGSSLRTELLVVPDKSSNNGVVLSLFSLLADMGVKLALEFGVVPADGESGLFEEFCE